MSGVKLGIKEKVEIRIPSLEVLIVFKDGLLRYISITYVDTLPNSDKLYISIDIKSLEKVGDKVINELIDGMLDMLESLISKHSYAFMKITRIIKEYKFITNYK